MNFILLDIFLLVLFILIISLLSLKNKKKIHVEGSLILYKTKWGMGLIDKVGEKYKKTLKFLSYISIFLGYLFMLLILLIIGQSVWAYFTTSIAQEISAPPIAPLLPYFPTLFGMESYFPPFYFVYFIVALLIVASVHEFSHGIFAKRYGVKIKSTGFAFFKYFPAFLGAFVEQDDKQMAKKTSFEQKSILSAGVFANFLTAILFYFILFGFFSLAYAPSGIIYNSYSFEYVHPFQINNINGINVSNPDSEIIFSLANNTQNFNYFQVGDKEYVLSRQNLEEQKGQEIFLFYTNSPAIQNQLGNIILNINDEKISSLEDLTFELRRYSPGEKINITTLKNNEEVVQEIEVGVSFDGEQRPVLGIMFYSPPAKGIGGIIRALNYEKPNIYYVANPFSVFIKDLLWWIVIINLLVAFFNMLPLGILDGGRFFYLTIIDITKSEKAGKAAFKFITAFILFLFLLLMLKWVWVLIF